jgi:hypothetical protein
VPMAMSVVLAMGVPMAVLMSVVMLMSGAHGRRIGTSGMPASSYDVTSHQPAGS